MWNYENVMPELPNIYEPMPSAATVMAFPLPRVQHQGMRPRSEYRVYPINRLWGFGDPNDLADVEDLYQNRLEAREQIDWECR